MKSPNESLQIILRHNPYGHQLNAKAVIVMVFDFVELKALYFKVDNTTFNVTFQNVKAMKSAVEQQLRHGFEPFSVDSPYLYAVPPHFIVRYLGKI